MAGYYGRPGEEYVWQSYQKDAGFITDPASTPDWGGASKGDIPSRPNIGATHTMIPFTPVKANPSVEWTSSDQWGLHDRHKKASFWGVGGIATDFLNAADPEKAFMQMAIDSIFYVPNVVVKWLDKRMAMQQKANTKLKEDIQKEQAEWMENRKELAKMFAGTPEKATDFLHQDFIKSKGDMNALAVNMAKENPELLQQAHIDLREDGKYNLNEKQKKELQWGTLAYRSAQLHGSAPRRHEVEQYVKQSDLFMNHGLYPKMFEEQEQKHQSEEQKRAEEQYVKDLAQRKDFLRNVVAEDGRSDSYYNAVIHQDLVRAAGDWNKLRTNMETATPDSDLGKMNKALEDLKKFHIPEVAGERSQEEKDAEQVRKQELLQQIIHENPFLEKIAPTLAHQIEKMEGKTNESNGNFEFKEDALNQVGVQLAVAYRFHQAYRLPAEGIDMRTINDELKQCVETDYYAEVQKDPSILQKMEDTIHSPSQKEKQEQQDRQEQALNEANKKLDNLQTSVSTVDAKTDDISRKIDDRKQELSREIQQSKDEINTNTNTQSQKTRGEVQAGTDLINENIDNRKQELSRQIQQSKDEINTNTNIQSQKTRGEVQAGTDLINENIDNRKQELSRQIQQSKDEINTNTNTQVQNATNTANANTNTQISRKPSTLLEALSNMPPAATMTDDVKKYLAKSNSLSEEEKKVVAQALIVQQAKQAVNPTKSYQFSRDGNLQER